MTVCWVGKKRVSKCLWVTSSRKVLAMHRGRPGAHRTFNCATAHQTISSTWSNDMNQRTSQLFQHLFQKAARQPPQPPNVEAREVVRHHGFVEARRATASSRSTPRIGRPGRPIAFNSKNLRKKSRSSILVGAIFLEYHTAYISKKDPQNNHQVARSPQKTSPKM